MHFGINTVFLSLTWDLGRLLICWFITNNWKKSLLEVWYLIFKFWLNLYLFFALHFILSEANDDMENKNQEEAAAVSFVSYRVFFSITCACVYLFLFSHSATD